jgi:hypothetical protein
MKRYITTLISLSIGLLSLSAQSLNDMTITNSGLSYPGLTSSSGGSACYAAPGPMLTHAAGPVALGVVYASLLLKVKDLSLMTGTGCWFGFSNTNPASTMLPVFTACLSFKKNGSGYQIGIERGSGGTGNQYAPLVANIGDVVFVVVRHDLSSQTSALWVNPPATAFGNNQSEPVPDGISATGNDTVSQIAAVFLRQASTVCPEMSIDELRVGNTWASVTPASVSAGMAESGDNKVRLSSTRLIDRVTITGAEGDCRVQFYATDGHLMNDVAVYGSQPISVSGLPKGVYLVKISNGGAVSLRKAVK